MRLITLAVLVIFISGVVLVGSAQGQFGAQTSITLDEWIASQGLDVRFCSYFGGDGEEWSNDIFYCNDGSIVLTGMSRSSNLPIMNAHQEEYAGGGDVFIVKLNPQFQVEFYTYFGGSGLEEPMALTVDHYGNIIVAGGTSSNDFPLLNPIQEELNGFSDAFLAKFNSGGNLLFSTYIGGSEFDRIEDIIIDPNGSYVVVGPTESADFYTTPGVYQEDFGGGTSDAFITTISSDNYSILSSTFFGNSTNDDPWAVGIDDIGDLVIVGMTNGHAIATESALQQTYGGGSTDTFVAKFTMNCSTLYWATLLGGNGWDFGDQVGFDFNNNIIVSGYTGSSDLPLVNQIQNDTAVYDAFFAKLSVNGESLLMSSYLGGNLEDRSYAMEVISGDAILITMPAASTDMPTTNAFQENCSGGSDGYIALVRGETPSIAFGSYFGGGLNDYVLGMSISGSGNIAVIGYTSSTDLPTLGAVQNVYGGGISDTMVWILSPPPVTIGVSLLPDVLIVVAIVGVVLIIGYGLRRRR